MELKTYVAQYIHKDGNGWAIINAYHPNQIEDILKNQGRFKDIVVTSFKEVKHFGNTMSIVYEGSITTLGKTPYDLAKQSGFKGTLEEWLESLKGPKGDRGSQGDKGDKGDKGEQGPIGKQGPQGIKGEAGNKGEKGEKGDTGEQGPVGPQGIQGPRGEKGDPGTTDFRQLENVPDTIEGFGIKDAYTKQDVENIKSALLRLINGTNVQNITTSFGTTDKLFWYGPVDRVTAPGIYRLYADDSEGNECANILIVSSVLGSDDSPISYRQIVIPAGRMQARVRIGEKTEDGPKWEPWDLLLYKKKKKSEAASPLFCVHKAYKAAKGHQIYRTAPTIYLYPHSITCILYHGDLNAEEDERQSIFISNLGRYLKDYYTNPVQILYTTGAQTFTKMIHPEDLDTEDDFIDFILTIWDELEEIKELCFTFPKLPPTSIEGDGTLHKGIAQGSWNPRNYILNRKEFKIEILGVDTFSCNFVVLNVKPTLPIMQDFRYAYRWQWCKKTMGYKGDLSKHRRWYRIMRKRCIKKDDGSRRLKFSDFVNGHVPKASYDTYLFFKHKNMKNHNSTNGLNVLYTQASFPIRPIE